MNTEQNRTGSLFQFQSSACITRNDGNLICMCVRKITKTASNCLSVLLSAWNNTARTERIFKKYYVSIFSKM